MKKQLIRIPLALAIAVLAMGGVNKSNAQIPPGNSLLSFDEFGNSSINGVPFQPGQLLPDPTGGYVAGPVLVYNLPFAGLPGDVLMHDAAEPGNPFLDVLRFDGAGHLVFYSDNIDGFDAPADTQSPPNPLLPNQANVQEGGVEGGFQDVIYTPTPSQPGWDPSGVTYQFISDVPEPTTLALAGLGGLAALVVARRRK